MVGRIRKMALPRFHSLGFSNTNLGTALKGLCGLNSQVKCLKYGDNSGEPEKAKIKHFPYFGRTEEIIRKIGSMEKLGILGLKMEGATQ